VFYRRQVFLVHLSDESVDLDFSVSEVTAFDEVVVHTSVATLGGRELEGPEEVVGSLEVGSNGEDLVDEILDGLNSDVTEASLDDGVLLEWDTLAVDLAVTSLVDELLDGLEVGVAPGDVRLSDVEHHNGGLVHLDEGGVSNLSESEELQDLLDSWRDLVDTSDSDDKGELWLSLDVDVAVLLRLSSSGNVELLLGGVFGSVRSSSLDDRSALERVSLLCVLLSKSSLGKGRLVSLSLLFEGFWDGRSHDPISVC